MSTGIREEEHKMDTGMSTNAELLGRMKLERR